MSYFKSDELTVLDDELKAKIQKISNTEKATVISFVAPQEAVRISPVSFTSAAIEEKEMYRLESIVNDSRSKQGTSDVLHFVIQTPGGELHTSYKIAYFLRNKFKIIKAFVPYQAASGGTILCCAANYLYIGELGNITPIDPQVRYKGNWVSARSFERATDTLKKLFGEMSPDEVPPPWPQMIDKLDPIIHDQMDRLVFNTYVYACRLLRKSGYDDEKVADIAYKIAVTDYTHSHAILVDEARRIGFNIVEDNDTMKVYSELVSSRLKERSSTHCIDAFYPEPEQTLPLPSATS